MKNILILLGAAAALSFTSCKKDPCEDVNCSNGGTCNEGTCACPEGFSGPECRTADTPANMTITQIDIVDFPGSNGGSDWDVLIDTDPDIIIEIENDGTSSNIFTSASFNNMADGSQFSINGLDILVESPNQSYTIKMIDDDLIGSESMGDITFTPWVGGSFPATISVNDATKEISYVLHVSYAW